MMAFDAPKAAQGRLIRLIDATMVPKAGAMSKMKNKLWRIHSAFDLPSERFGLGTALCISLRAQELSDSKSKAVSERRKKAIASGRDEGGQRQSLLLRLA